MEKLAEEIYDEYECNDTIYTPENIAWKLLMDDDDEKLSSAIQTFCPSFEDTESDSVSYFFEVLLTIFMEMIFDLAILLNMKENETNGEDFMFDPDMDNFNMEDFIPTLKKKFNKISIITHVSEYEKNDPVLESVIGNRYCRIILKHLPKDRPLFKKYNVSEDMNYHMVLGSNFTSKKKLKEVYAVIIIKDIAYKIYFDTLSH